MMKSVKVRYFAVLRERRGVDEETFATECSTVGDLVQKLISEHRLGLPTALIRGAVENQFVEPSHQLEDGMEIVLIPPVSGG